MADYVISIRVENGSSSETSVATCHNTEDISLKGKEKLPAHYVPISGNQGRHTDGAIAPDNRAVNSDLHCRNIHGPLTRPTSKFGRNVQCYDPSV
jgi:hypothetical protein